MDPPEYFERIRRESAARWDTLEADPVLAAPWRQLFQQIQSPRHVLSELLQNAEDAGARCARVMVNDGEFAFRHDGLDFSPTNFESLCRFGYSDKKALHTIGFRGLGFKSTFSLGDTVRMTTPTLAVFFHRERFTEPIWTGTGDEDAGTAIRVSFKDANREREIIKNLADWARSPLSLLFFRSLRTLEIGDEVVQWEEAGPGPIPRSEWLRLSGSGDTFLVIRSDTESFPDDALREVREERGANDDFELPPCEVTLVLGAEGRLFVVLPTGVRPNLPFAVNAPFVQDPSRVEIKDPAVSPTNRWLLERAGRLAADAMTAWLGNKALSLAERARAYELLPAPPKSTDDLGADCASLVSQAFLSAVAGEPCLLTETGEVVVPDGAIVVPPALFNVWPATELPEILGRETQSPVAGVVTEQQRQKLAACLQVDRLSRTNVAELFLSVSPPKPKSWRQLVSLWAFLSPELSGYPWNPKRSLVRMVPVPGATELHRAADLVRLGDKRLLNREEDWQFLSEYAVVLDQNWVRYLAAERKRAEEREDEATVLEIDTANDFLAKLGLNDASSPTEVFARFVKRFIADGSDSKISTWVRIAEMAAALGASPPTVAMFVTRDAHLRPAEGLIYDPDGSVRDDHPAAWADTNVLHDMYSRERESCSDADWERWVATHFGQLPPLVQRGHYMRRSALEEELRTRGYGGPLPSRYSYPSFSLIDWDFDEQHWNHWHELALTDVHIWRRLMVRLLSARRLRTEQWRCEAREDASNGNSRALPLGVISARWIVKLRELPCLRDTKGFLRKPSELLCLTPETNSLYGVVPFVETEFDTEANRDLLVALGVGTRPNSTEHLLRRLRALSNAQEPPLLELAKLYEALDGVARTCSPDELTALRGVFADEKLIFTRQAGWATSANAYAHADESDAPEAPVVLPEFKDLTLWNRLGVPERPTAEMALTWLASLPIDAPLSPEDLRRVRALQTRYPARVWEECGRWLNLNSKLSSTDDLRFSLTMQEMVTYTGLFPWVRDVTANFQTLPVPVLSNAPFSSLPTLASSIDERLSQELVPTGELSQPWMATVGERLLRILLGDDEHQAAVRAVAERMARSSVLSVRALQAVPHVGGVPAGTPRSVPAMWADDHLYVLSLPSAQLVKPLTDAVAQPLQPYGLADVIRLCYQRDRAFIEEYLDANFEFEAAPEPRPTGTDELDPALVEHGESPAAAEEAHAVGLVERTDTPASVGRAHVDSDLAPTAPDEDELTRTDSIKDALDDEEVEDPTGPDAEPSDAGARPRTRQTAPRMPSLMERFAASLGYEMRDAGLFEGPAGEILMRERGDSFPWQLHVDGQPVRYYWPKESDLDHEPVSVPAAVWHLLQSDPQNHFFVLKGADGAPAVFAGQTLLDLVESQDLGLFAAEYRLTKRADD